MRLVAIALALMVLPAHGDEPALSTDEAVRLLKRIEELREMVNDQDRLLLRQQKIIDTLRVATNCA